MVVISISGSTTIMISIAMISSAEGVLSMKEVPTFAPSPLAIIRHLKEDG